MVKIGIFGTAEGTTLKDGLLELNGPGLPYGTYEVPFLVSQAIRLSLTLQAVDLDLASPIGIGLTQATRPVDL